MKEALTLAIQPTTHNNSLIYTVQVVHQKYRGTSFTTTGRTYTAPNGFALSAQHCPALYASSRRCNSILIKGKVVYGVYRHDVDMLCVRGTDDDSDNTLMYTNSLVYVTDLKSAVASYNKHMV